MTQVEPSANDDLMVELKSIKTKMYHNNNNYHNFDGEAVDVDDAILNGTGSRSTTAGSRKRSVPASRLPSRISITENGSVIDYGVVSPMPPPLPYPPMTPLTHFGRNASAISQMDTLKMTPEVGSRAYWQMKSATAISNGPMSDTTSTSGVVSAGESSSVSGLKKPGTAASVYGGMYRGADEPIMLDGLRSRTPTKKMIMVTDEEG